MAVTNTHTDAGVNGRRGSDWRLVVSLALLACIASVVPILDVTQLLSGPALVKINDAAQLVAGSLAAATCWWIAKHTDGTERLWRRRMARGMTGWTIGMAIWAWYQVVVHRPLPSPTLADAGFFALPVFALGALLALWSAEPEEPRRSSTILVLDGAVLVGSLFTLTWITALGDVFREGHPSGFEGVVGVAYPLTDLLLVTIVGFLILSERVPRPYRSQLWLLAAGLGALSLSDSAFAYLVANGADTMAPRYDAGFVAGPLLIALAAATTSHSGATGTQRVRRLRLSHVNWILPVVVALTVVAVIVQFNVGGKIDTIERASAGTLVCLVVLRVVVASIVHGTISTELHERQVHDALLFATTRSALLERLDEARRRLLVDAVPYGLLVVDVDGTGVIDQGLSDTAAPRLARRLRESVRQSDLLVRLDAERFAVLIEGTPLELATAGARLVETVRTARLLDSAPAIELRASVGYVTANAEEVSLPAEALLERALAAADAASRLGAGTVSAHDRRMGPQADSYEQPAEEGTDAAMAAEVAAHDLASLMTERHRRPERRRGFVSGAASMFNPAGVLRRRHASFNGFLADINALTQAAVAVAPANDRRSDEESSERSDRRRSS